VDILDPGGPGRSARGRSGLVALLVVGLATALAGCDPAPKPPPATSRTSSPLPVPSTSDGDWPTYHRDNTRAGVAAGLPPLAPLSRAWEAKLDGAVYGQPLVVGDVVYAATENDTVYALDAGSGRLLWSAHVGTPVPRSNLPCGNIDPLGITSTMVYDPASRLVFALAETTGAHHTLVSIDAATGAVREQRPAEPPKGDRVAHQQRSALTLLNGRIYVGYGGLAGDCGRYFGSVVALPTTGGGAPISYAVPTTREAGIWAPGGASVRGDRMYFPVGNGESTAGYDGSDSVLALTPDLALVDSFAPKTWAADNAKDLDLGSMTPALVGDYVYADGKRGVGYLLKADHLGGIGGEVAQAEVCQAYGASAVDGDTVYVPCADGPRAVSVSGSGQMTVRWHAPVRARGSPVVGAGAVWVVDYDGGWLYALDPGTGQPRQQLRIGTAPHFASPTLAHRHAYVGTLAGVVAVGWA
jgi:polyvinyl alcohol dehydrogenase (cytochrome)